MHFSHQYPDLHNCLVEKWWLKPRTPCPLFWGRKTPRNRVIRTRSASTTQIRDLTVKGEIGRKQVFVHECNLFCSIWASSFDLKTWFWILPSASSYVFVALCTCKLWYWKVKKMKNKSFYIAKQLFLLKMLLLQIEIISAKAVWQICRGQQCCAFMYRTVFKPCDLRRRKSSLKSTT